VPRLPAQFRTPVGLLAAAALLGGCSWFGGSSDTKSVSVFSIEPGQCFQTPSKVHAQLSELDRRPCDQPHTREAYAVVEYAAASGQTAATTYPGEQALSAFAQGSCAQHYRDYVGVDYLDSSLFFTYLMPSARSWQQDDDRKVICFVMGAGQTLTSSVKDSKR
jgi:hypothetical protein